MDLRSAGDQERLPQHRKLGAITRRYNQDQYGITSSPLQGGLPTDRHVAEWWFESCRVEQAIADKPKPKFEIEQTITVPAQVYEWKASAATREQAHAVQARNRRLFLRAFTDGLSVLGYERDSGGNGKYLLGKWDEPWKY